MNTRRIVFIAVLSAILFISQVAIAFLPNIELVTLLLIIYTLHMPLKDVLFITVIFSTLEGLTYGFHIWAVMYYFIWPLYVIIIYLLKNKLDSWFKVALLGSSFGLCFGSLHAIPYFLMGGIQAGIAYIIAGLVFDLIHGIANFILITILFDPINKFFSHVYKTS